MQKLERLDYSISVLFQYFHQVVEVLATGVSILSKNSMGSGLPVGIFNIENEFLLIDGPFNDAS